MLVIRYLFIWEYPATEAQVMPVMAYKGLTTAWPSILATWDAEEGSLQV